MNDQSRRVIYDFGANNGDNIPYYLLKADKVVAVEANPVLCAGMKDRFADEVEAGKLVIENFVLTTSTIKDLQVPFYVHKKEHVLSQFPKPADMAAFDEISLPARPVIDIISDHGAAHYIKIDIEHYDHEILGELFANDIFPDYISAESHSLRVLGLFLACGQYHAFKLVDGMAVAEEYKNHSINVGDGVLAYSFPFHSSGPFGEDVKGDWLNQRDFMRVLGAVGPGWKDIHASRRIKAAPLKRRKIELALLKVTAVDAANLIWRTVSRQ